MANHSHRSRRLSSSDSGYDTNSDRPSSPLHDRIKGNATQENIIYVPATPPRKHGPSTFLSCATRKDITVSIGTELLDIQLSKLDPQQLDKVFELASERGVIFFRDQDLTQKDQIRISDHLGTDFGKRIVERNQRFVKMKNDDHDHGENWTYAPGQQHTWQSDKSFETAPTSYSIVKARGPGPNMTWISQYGVYDALSKHIKGLLESLHAVHDSSIRYSSIANLRGLPINQGPFKIQHPAVQTHPITGLKALNVTPGTVSGFAELTSKESKMLLELIGDQFESLDEHKVHFKWEARSVAIWDNRCTAHKSIPSFSTGVFNSTETTIAGEKPHLNHDSESRLERVSRQALEVEDIHKVKARFNNTPLRRILRRQTNKDQNELSSSEFEPVASPKTDMQSSILTDKTLCDEGSIQGASQGQSEVAYDDPIIVVEKTSNAKNETSIRVQVTFKGSPLRRIIQRQVSAKR